MKLRLMAVMLTLASACTGQIGDRGASAGPSGGGGTGSGRGGASGAGMIPTTPPANAGALVVRRLNHAEYDNTVRDLLGTSLRPSSGFPADDLGGEFDTVGSALSLSPAYVIAYEATAHALVADLYAGTAARRQQIVTCDVETGGDACARTVLSAFARRAWRRPVTTEEVDGLLLPLTTARSVGATATEGLRHALAAVLLSPFFVFKVEIDPDPTSTQSRRVSPHELATRLSYALWSSMPDDALGAAADAGQLATDEQVSAQIDRMLADPRADALLDEFAAEWLEWKELESHDVDTRAFPSYTPALARSMKAEARRFIQEFLRSETPAAELLSARFTFVDAGLGTHYGLPRPAGSAATDFVRVDTAGAPRAGLLTLGAFLTATSFPTRTSPVKRGELIFKRLLCGTILAPPPDVPPLPEDAQSGLPLRKRLEAHRANPDCAGCHDVMDPLGFGLENYDAIGAYRTTEGGSAVDASGVMPDGRRFNGAVELAGVLSGDTGFSDCLTRKLMTYMIGRLLDQRDDSQWVLYLANRSRMEGGSLKKVIRTVLLSEVFRSRQPARI